MDHDEICALAPAYGKIPNISFDLTSMLSHAFHKPPFPFVQRPEDPIQSLDPTVTPLGAFEASRSSDEAVVAYNVAVPFGSLPTGTVLWLGFSANSSAVV